MANFVAPDCRTLRTIENTERNQCALSGVAGAKGLLPLNNFKRLPKVRQSKSPAEMLGNPGSLSHRLTVDCVPESFADAHNGGRCSHEKS